jgi:hypothetical protein
MGTREGVIIVVILLVVVVVVVIAVLAAAKRRAAHQALCVQRGWSYSPSGPIPEPLMAFPIFAHGHTREVRETIRGTHDGQPFTLFEYVYVTGHGKHRHHHHHTIVQWSTAELPVFSLTPEGWMSRLGNVFGTQDIDFDDDPAFSRAFQLRGDDEHRVRALFTPDRRRALAQDLHLCGGYGTLYYWSPRSMPRAADLDATLAAGASLRRLITGG